MWRTMTGTICLAVFSILTGCGGDVQTSDRDIQMINETDLVAAVEADNAVLVDVRSPRQFHEGHIPGAINLPRQHLRANDPRLGGKNMIVVYSSIDLDGLTKGACKRLIELRYNNVYAFRGGVDLWEDAGHTLVKGKPDPGRAESSG